jgi:hypothetical protein
MKGLLVFGALVLGWAGFATHNFADLPGEKLTSPDTLYPSLIFIAIGLLWLTPARRTAAWSTLTWNGLHLIGGAIISVLPLRFLPFHPDQTPRHYLFHLLYGTTQLPTLLIAWHNRRTPTAQSTETRSATADLVD